MSYFFQRRKSIPPPEPVAADAPQLHGAELAAMYLGERRGGEFHDFLRAGHGRVIFAFLDVAGRKGENADIVSAAQQTFRKVAPDLFAPVDVNEPDALVEVGLHLNRAIMARCAGVHSCPGFAACYNEELGTICYFNAGHTPGLVRSSTGISELSATGLPLGLFSHATWDAPTLALEDYGALLLVSRGTVEGKGEEAEVGLHHVKTNLQDSKAQTAQQLCASILESLPQFAASRSAHNDLAAVALLRATAKMASAAAS